MYACARAPTYFTWEQGRRSFERLRAPRLLFAFVAPPPTCALLLTKVLPQKDQEQIASVTKLGKGEREELGAKNEAQRLK